MVGPVLLALLALLAPALGSSSSNQQGDVVSLDAMDPGAGSTSPESPAHNNHSIYLVLTL